MFYGKGLAGHAVFLLVFMIPAVYNSYINAENGKRWLYDRDY